MNEFEKELIYGLLNRYEHSVLSKGGSERNLSIRLDVKKDKELKSYTGPKAALYRKDNDEVILKLERMSFICAFFDEDDYLQKIELNVNNVEKLYDYSGRENPKNELARIRKVIDTAPKNDTIQKFCDYLLCYLDKKYTYPKMYFENAEQLRKILICIYQMYLQEEEIMERDFSVRNLGDSKKFSPLVSKVTSIIADFDENIPYSEKDEILSYFNIVKNSTYAMVKNNLVFSLNQVTIDLNKLGYEYLLSDEMIKNIVIHPSTFSKVITVENLTSFKMLDEKDAVIIYLAGFHNHTKELLLKKIYEIYPSVSYYHFGDIDAGGFYIFNHLKVKTKIPFIPYRMNKDELINNSACLKFLTENDRKKLNMMLSKNEFYLFREVIELMLEKNVKLEQEILD